MFPVHTTPEKFKNTTTNDYPGFAFERLCEEITNHVILEISLLLSFFKAELF